MKIFLLWDESLSCNRETGKPYFLHRVPKEHVNEVIQQVADEAQERMGENVAVVIVLPPVIHKIEQVMEKLRGQSVNE